MARVYGQFYTWEDYFIPGTQVLKNLLGYADATDLAESEEALATLALHKLSVDPVVGDFDLAHMCAIHEIIFGDVYAWAGEIRTAPAGAMTKSAPDVVNFPPGHPAAPLVAYKYLAAGPDMVEAANRQYERINVAELSQLVPVKFVEIYADIWSQLNVAHCFREGNTRTQGVFFSQLATACGYTLDTDFLAPHSITRDGFVDARFFGQATGDSSRLKNVLARSLIRDGKPIELSQSGQQRRNRRDQEVASRWERATSGIPKVLLAEFDSRAVDSALAHAEAVGVNALTVTYETAQRLAGGENIAAGKALREQIASYDADTFR